MTVKVEAPAAAKNMEFPDKDKPGSVRSSNIVAAKSVADAVRTSLGPRGMDKMIQSGDGEVTITNDGATILNLMSVVHPTAKMLVELAKAQDIEAGDGTTTVVVMAGALLDAAEKLLAKGIHPTIISEFFQRAAAESEKILETMSTPVDLNNDEELIKLATTSLNSKVVSHHSNLLAPMAVKAVKSIIDVENDINVNLKMIKIVQKLGDTVDESQLIEGALIEQRSMGHGGPIRVEKAKIGLIQFQISPPKTNMENQVVISDYTQMDRALKEERNYILNLCKKVKNSGCNVLLIQKSILRDAINEQALHFFAKMKIMVIKDIERDDIEFYSKILGCRPIASADHLTAEALGLADLVEEIYTSGEDKVVKVTGLKNSIGAVSILLRGSNKLMLEEAERSLHDALCVIRCLVKKRALLPGGGAPEMEVAVSLRKLARTKQGAEQYCWRAFADAMELIPYTLAENAGISPIGTVTDLRNEHAKGNKDFGVSVRTGVVTNIRDENVVQPFLVTSFAIKQAAECVRSILKIDDISTMQSLESAFGKALHQPMPFTTGGQTITDRLMAAKHSLAGSQLGKTICKATTEELMAPKKKHCDYLLHCTNEPNISIPSMANLLIERTQNPNWIVIYKALITIHNLMCYGNEYLASCNTTINLSGFLDKSNMQTSAMAAGYDMSMHVRRYAKYISEKIHTYRLCAFDFCKLKRGREDGVLRVMHADKLLKTLPILQNQIDALLEFQVTSSELNNGVINCSFILLFRDLIRLFACYNDGIINLLEKFFDMNKKQCREAFDLYKAFLFRLDRVSEFLRVAESVGIDRGEIPDLTRAPASLLEALEAHLYHLESGKGAPPTSSAQQIVNQQIQQQNDSFNALTQNLSVAGDVDELAKQKYLEEEKERLRQYEKLRQKQIQQNPQASAAPPQLLAAASNPFGGASTNSTDLLSFYDSPAQQQQPGGIGLDSSNPFASAYFDTNVAPNPTVTSQPQPSVNPFMAAGGSNVSQANSVNPFDAFGAGAGGSYGYNQNAPFGVAPSKPPLPSQPPFGQPFGAAPPVPQQPPTTRPGIYDQTPFGPPLPSSTAADNNLSNLVSGLRISSPPQMPPMYQQQSQAPLAGYVPMGGPPQQQQPWNAFGPYNPPAGYGNFNNAPQMSNYDASPVLQPNQGYFVNFPPQQAPR